MTRNLVLGLMVLLGNSMWMGQGQIIQPQLTSNNFLAKITTNSVILAAPNCIFDQTVCPGNCDVWLVAALASATGTFNSDSLLNFNLAMSPYPTAFSPFSKNYFLTRVGSLAAFPCNQSSSNPYFIVGANGLCSTTNCNGILPAGSIVSFKYLLLNGTAVLFNQTGWSNNITLFISQSPSSINDGLSARSGAMVVITTLLCVAVGLLLLFFLILICLTCFGTSDSKPIVALNSFHMPKYDTHNLKDQVHPYDNPAYEREVKNYSLSDTLPRSGAEASSAVKTRKL